MWAQTGKNIFIDSWKKSVHLGSKMYIRITKAGGHEYARPVESFREGGKVRKRVIANLGRVEEIKRNPGKLESLAGGVNGLMGRAENSVSKFDFNEAPAYGNVFALDELRKDLGIDKAPNAPCDPGVARPTRTR